MPISQLTLSLLFSSQGPRLSSFQGVWVPLLFNLLTLNPVFKGGLQHPILCVCVHGMWNHCHVPTARLLRRGHWVMIVHTKQWGSCAVSAGMQRFKPYQQAAAEQCWPLFGPFLFWKGATLHCLWYRFKKGEVRGISHILPLRALIHGGSCLYTLIWLRQSRGETEQKGGRGDGATGRGKQKVFVFLYICKGRICGTRVKEVSSCFVFRVGPRQSSCCEFVRARQQTQSSKLHLQTV